MQRRAPEVHVGVACQSVAERWAVWARDHPPRGSPTSSAGGEQSWGTMELQPCPGGGLTSTLDIQLDTKRARP